MGGADEHGGAGSDPRKGRSDAERELERRLGADERRIDRDEERLYQDERRIAEGERWIRRNWRLALALSALLAVTITALVISVIALNRDIEAVARATPKQDSVGSAAIRDGAVTRGKLAPDSVTRAAIADGAVTTRKVARNGLTGAAIDESTLGAVPRAARADLAADASALGGLEGRRYLSQVAVVQRATATSTLQAKGPIAATCPRATTVVGGGAAIDGARDVAITTSAPDGRGGWLAEAAATGSSGAPWRIVVTAICVAGG